MTGGLSSNSPPILASQLGWGLAASVAGRERTIKALATRRALSPADLLRPQNRRDHLDRLVGTPLPQSRELGRGDEGLDQGGRVMGVTMCRDRLSATGGERAKQGKDERTGHRGWIIVVVGRQFNRGFLPCGSPRKPATPPPQHRPRKTPKPRNPQNPPL